MVLFKVNGERNSGTNFLLNILKTNNFPAMSDKSHNNIVGYWKHGVPNKRFKMVDERVIDIFIFRDLESWLVSMFHNPYELSRNFDNLKQFLTKKLIPNTPLKKPSGIILNHDDKDKTIFDVRYHKFNNIINYKNTQRDVILVNLSYLQNETNLQEFLQTLNDLYIHKPITNYVLCIPHTKSGKETKNRSYTEDINTYENIISKHRNDNIETFINSLTFSIH